MTVMLTNSSTPCCPMRRAMRARRSSAVRASWAFRKGAYLLSSTRRASSGAFAIDSVRLYVLWTSGFAVCSDVFDSVINYNGHVKFALQAVEKLNAEKKSADAPTATATAPEPASS
jgi:hypothetical protein